MDGTTALGVGIHMAGKRILILYTSVGLGHKSIAENIAAVLSGAGFEVKLSDILQVQAAQSGRLIGFWQKFYLLSNEKLPWFWKWIYNSSNRGLLAALTLPLRLPLAGQNYRQLLTLIKTWPPDLVLSCETVASAVVAYLKQKGLYQGKFAIGFSDFHLHRYWLYPGCDFYLANIAEQKSEMISWGIKPEQVAVCGITLKPQTQVNTPAVKARLEISPDQKVILVGVGSLGIGLNQNIFRQLAALANVKILVVCGKNQELFELLSKEFANFPQVKILGFYLPMDELYAIANLFITKPGGLSTAEALRWRVPLVVTHWLPGGEDLNIQYLFKRHLITVGPEDLKAFLENELKTGLLKKELENSSEVAKIAQDGQAVITAIQTLLHGV